MSNGVFGTQLFLVATKRNASITSETLLVLFDSTRATLFVACFLTVFKLFKDLSKLNLLDTFLLPSFSEIREIRIFFCAPVFED